MHYDLLDRCRVYGADAIAVVRNLLPGHQSKMKETVGTDMQYHEPNADQYCVEDV